MPHRLSYRPRFVLIAAFLLAVGALLVGCAEDDVPGTANPFPERTNILVVHSYDESFRWSSEQGQGIVDGLDAAGLRQGLEYNLRVFYMDTRLRYTTPEQIAARAAEATALIEELHPAVVFITDDPALRTVAVPYVEAHPDTKVAFVFSGINIDPTVYKPIASLEAPGGRITGVLERIPVGAAMTVANRVFPEAERAAVLADGSGSSAAALADYNKTYPGGLHSPIEVTSFTLAKTFAQWQAQVRSANTNADLLGLVNYHGLTDEAGNIVPPADVLAWTLANSTNPVMGLVRDWVGDGMPVAVGNSGVRNGIASATIGAAILDGKDPGTVRITDVKLYETAFNARAIRALGLTIPQAEIEKADLVVH